jgi:hypothetical protein
MNEYFFVLDDNPTHFSSMLFFIYQQMQQSTFENMKSNVGKQTLKWGDRLTEAGAQFGTDRTWHSWGSNRAMTRRLWQQRLFEKW